LEDTDYYKSFKTRIIGTIGPASYSKEKIVKMIKEGMTIARINLYHGDLIKKLALLKTI